MPNTLNTYTAKKFKRTAYAVIEIMHDKGSYQHMVQSISLARGIERSEGFELFSCDLKDNEDYKLPWKTESIPWIEVPLDDIPLVHSLNRMVPCCAFDATNNYCQKHLGFRFDNDDRSWYSEHHLVNTDGLPQANTFAVIQQLVSAYGAGISQIVLPRNCRQFSDYSPPVEGFNPFMPFIQALGANPFFLQDGYTTNEEALVKLFPNEKRRNEMRPKMFKLWKFECRDKPLNGAIVMRQFGHKETGHNGGSFYQGPRAYRSATWGSQEWKMSMKIDRNASNEYIKPIVLPEYKPWSGSENFDLNSIVDPGTKKTLEDLSGVKVYSGASSSNSQPNWGNNYPQLADNYGSMGDPYDDEECNVCGNDVGMMMVDGDQICQYCRTFVPLSGGGGGNMIWDGDRYHGWHS